MEAPSAVTQPRVRSSIACARCRRSKIKCVNTGAYTRCKACEASGRECVYPAPAAAGSGGTKREGERVERGEVRRQRVRRSEGNAADKSTSSGIPNLKESGRPLTEALDSTVLTPKVWQDVFDLFQLHFATDLPFLHGPTFLGPLCGATAKLPSAVVKSTPEPEEVERLPGYEMLLLGILALTARFHPGLVAYHSPTARSNANEPVVASEYYATVLRALLVGEKGVYIGQPNLEKIQALLMLGLHEWGMCKGIKAWIHVGLAIRMAQAMGLQFDDDLDDEPWALSSAMRIEAQHLGVRTGRDYPSDPSSGEVFIDEEVRRRTFWSCFIMDRYLSSGKFRPAMLATEDVRLQLPSSEHAFIFGERVCTNMITGRCSGSENRARRKARIYANIKDRSDALKSSGVSIKREGKDLQEPDDETDEIKIRCEFGADEGLLSKFVRMVEIWGKIAKWSCAGGRRTEKHAPWNPESRFHQLRESLSKFYDSIPRPFRLTPANMQAHLSQRTSSPFTLLHTLYSLCLIVLHREYVPFVPIRCDKPEGPLDDPATPDQSEMPSRFWEDSARQLFKAGRDIMDLVQACQSRELLVETPVLGFGLYTVAFVGVYAINFPHMDPDGYMCGRSGDPEDVAGGHQAARKALEMIGQMRSRLPMANNWFRTIHRMHRYYEKIIKDYKTNTQALREAMAKDGTQSPKLYRQLSLREGGFGGGNESYKLLEKTLKEFGSIEDEDAESVPGDGDRKPQRLSPNSGDGCQTQELQSSDRWTAVNLIRSSDYDADTSDNRRPPPESYYSNTSHNTPYTHQSRPQPLDLPRFRPVSLSNPPSLISPGSTSTPTPSLPSASPYQRSINLPNPSSPSHRYPHQQVLPISQQLYASPTEPYQQQRPQTNCAQSSSTQQQASAYPQPHSSNPSNEQRPWSEEKHSHWLNSLKKPLGGDDVAAFVDGRSCEEWVQFQTPMVRGDGGGKGWLREVWGGVWGVA